MKSRDPAVHDWPCRVNRMAVSTPAAVASMFSGVAASGKTMFGLLPPSSRETCAKRFPAASATCRPTSVDPVNDTLSTSGCSSRASPITEPLPVTTFSTPGGRNSEAISAIFRMVSGASWAVFRISVLPAANDAGVFIPAIIKWGIPGQDSGHHPERFAAGVLELIVTGRQDGALEFAGDAAEVPEEVDQGLGFRPGLGAQRISGIGRGQQGQFLGAFLEGVGNPQQGLLPILEMQSPARPGRRPGRP